LNPTTERFLAQITAKKISPEKYSEVILKWSSFQKQMLEFANANAEIILCPVCSSAAPKIGSNVLVDFSYSSYFNVLGWPTATVRVGKTATGLPIGIQIAGRPWKENEVLAVAAFLETALGGWEKDFAPALR
jgi:amidase